MTNMIIYVTFIPWLFYFVSSCRNAIKVLEKNKVTKKWLRKNILSMFHFDNLILFGIFIYFSYNYPDADQIWLVEVLLFSVIHLYLYFNRMHDKDNKKGRIDSRGITILSMLLLFVLVPFLYYTVTKNYIVTYYILFAYSFFHYLLVILCKNIYMKFNVLFVSHEEK